MANDKGTSTRKRSGGKPLRYFFINQDLHKVLRVVRPQDFMEAWNFREGKRTGYIWSDVRKRMENAFTMQQVGQMVGRTRVQIENYILEGKIKTPQRIYTLDERKKPGKYLFSETDVLALHDYLLTVHIGRPRKDGKITPGKMPTRAELRAMLKHNIITYVKTDDNEFKPIWKEIDW